jgi:hypothetical protein
MVKRFLRALLIRWTRALTPPPVTNYAAENHVLKELLRRLSPDESTNFYRFREMASELIEARMMCGGGPSMCSPGPEMLTEANHAMVRIQEAALKGLRETVPVSGVGAFGDIELALQNIDWRREINMSWLEFSRWGIQQIILISRLYYIKQPLMRRAIDVVAAYVFGRGVEISSTDDDANDVLNEFFERNRGTFGPTAMVASQRAKSMDGNLFWVFFADTTDKGLVDARRLDATEIQEIASDPDDSDKEQFFKRTWTQRVFNPVTGSYETKPQTCWYPALGFDPPIKPLTIGTDPVHWGRPVLHRKHGAVAKWSFGCPEGYPALEWIKTAARYMQSCATLAASHAQIAWDVTTKGGQAAIEGTKQQIQTQVNAQPGSQIWDNNPTPVNASMLVKGPGSEWKMVNSRGQGLDPKEGLTYNVYVGNVFGIPPTWLGDMETSNLSTATTLDRPTELGMRCRQTEWEDDLTVIAKFVLEVSAGAASGKLREALRARSIEKVVCIEAPRKTLPNGLRVYDEAAKPKDDEIHVRVTFPAIREGDMPAIIGAIVASMTLDNKGGQIVGIDEREGVRLLYETLGVEEPEEILDEQYPLSANGVKGTVGYTPKYDPNRTKTPLPPPIGKALPNPGGQPQLPGGQQPQQSTAAPPPPGGVPNAPGAQPAQESAFVKRLAALIEAVRKKAA